MNNNTSLYALRGFITRTPKKVSQFFYFYNTYKRELINNKSKKRSKTL